MVGVPLLLPELVGDLREGKTLPQREWRSTDTAQPAFTCGS